MVVFNLAYTAPINCPDQSVLTRDQVWAGLQRKVRHAQEFVPLIVKCEVVQEEVAARDEDVTVVTRQVIFAPGKGPKADGEPVTEVCKEYPPCRVDFHQENGTKIANYVSQGPSGQPDDLFMTYVFEWRHPAVQAGSEQAGKLEAQHKTVSFCRRAFLTGCILTVNRLRRWQWSPVSRPSAVSWPRARFERNGCAAGGLDREDKNKWHHYMKSTCEIFNVRRSSEDC